MEKGGSTAREFLTPFFVLWKEIYCMAVGWQLQQTHVPGVL